MGYREVRLELPPVYANVSIAGAPSLAIERTTFRAALDEEREVLQLRFRLQGDHALTWSSTGGWIAIEGDRQRVLGAGERVVFSD